MERLTQISIVAALIVLAIAGCATPEVLIVKQEIPHVERPRLPVEDLTKDATAAEISREIEASLLLCIGYARQLEAAQGLDDPTKVPEETRD